MTTTIGEYLVNAVMSGVNDGAGVANVVNSFQIVGSEGRLILRQGNPGEEGPQGPTAFPWKWRGDVADYTALQAIESTLTLAHKGYAYRVAGGALPYKNAVMYWDGEVFYPFLNAFGAEGPRGVTCNITVGTVTTTAAGTDASISITGTPPNLTLNATIPRGVQGEVGPVGGPGSITGSPDVKPGIALVQNDVLVWDAANNRFDRRPYPGWTGPYALANSDFSSGSNQSAATTVIATKTVPPQPFSWRPFVQGSVSSIVHVASIGASVINTEVHLGSSSGQIVALGAGLPAANWYAPAVAPYFGAAISPDSPVGTVAANTTTTLYVVLQRAYGTSNYSWENTAANMVIYCQPVVAP